jgi:glyoxalase family protein
LAIRKSVVKFTMEEPGMNGATAGIHHITVIASDAQRNLDFYAGVLGLRLVKKTVNFDDPETYHFYFGDSVGTPGTILTFFPWSASGLRGRAGPGQVTRIAFSVPGGTLGFWKNRLQQFQVDVIGEKELMDGARIAFHDPDGLALELVDAGSAPTAQAWTGHVPAQNAIRGFHSATLTVEHAEATAQFLSGVLGFTEEGKGSGRWMFSAADAAGDPGTLVEIVPVQKGAQGRMGVGAVHHIAWRARDDQHQLALRSAVVATGSPATPVIDRIYFHSVYFHEPSGVLFEIATDPPGFSADEPSDSLGTHLQLPPWLEKLRPGLEKALPVVVPEPSAV